MARIRLTQAGYTTFTGEMGHIEFKDGVSVLQDVNPDFVRSLSGIVQLEDVNPDVPETAPEGDGDENEETE